MKEYSGTLVTVGASTTTRSLNFGTNMITTYSYIQIGDQVIKKLKAYTGIAGEIQMSLGNDITIYMQGKYLVGVKRSDGRVFASEGDNVALNIFIFLSVLLLAVVLTPFVIGLPIWILVWMMWSRLSAGLAARGLPEAILI